METKKNNTHFSVINRDIEADHKVKLVQSVKRSPIMLFVVIILIVLSGFILGLVFRWKPQYYIRLVYIPVAIELATHFIITGFDSNIFACKLQKHKSEIYFEYKYIKYKYYTASKSFQPLEFIVTEANTTAQSIVQIGLEEQIVAERLSLYGASEIKIPKVSIFEYVAKDLTSPFYVIQYVCICIWIIEGFYFFAVSMFSCSLISTFVKYFLLREVRENLQQLAKIEQNMKVFRNVAQSSDFIQVSSKKLVPGDVIQIQDFQKVPADCLLIQGEIMVNEATLTGESIPVPKCPLPKNLQEFLLEKHQQHVLFEGTVVINTKNVLALVIRTGFSTVRGQYFRNVLYPNEKSHEFYYHAIQFLGGLFGVAIMCYCIVLYIYLELEYSYEIIIARFVGIFTWVFPPAMPIFFSITGTIALVRLNLKGIAGQNLDKIHIAGKIDTICFDKTGTMTYIGLQLIEAWYPQDSQNQQYVLNSCHHLVKVNGELVGDIIDLEMFKYSKGEIQFETKNPFNVITVSGEKIEILKIFDFSSNAQMMSVIVKVPGQDKFLICSKGAPEKIFELLSSNEDTNDAQQILSQYTSKGFRVISIATKWIDDIDLENLQREDVEKNLKFCGFLFFENKLKKDTAEVVRELKKAQLQLKIISGDNPQTTINCAKQAGIIDNHKQVTLLDYDETNKQVICTAIQNNSLDSNIEENVQFKQDQEYAMTGKYLLNMKQEDKKIIEKTKVFSRVKPDQKKQVVQILQELGHMVAMVGDGSNDCSAISQAQIGVSFTFCDASYTAPFSSKHDSIKCIALILMEGKATTQILNEIFIYYEALSFLSFVAYSCIAVEASNYSNILLINNFVADLQIIYVSFGCYLPILAFMALTKPLEELKPYLPQDNMFTTANQLSIYVHILMGTIGLILPVCIIKLNPDHEFDLPEKPISEFYRKGLLNSTTFIIALAYSSGCTFLIFMSQPFKQQLHRNYLLSFWLLLHIVGVLVYLFIDEVGARFDMVNLNSEMDHFKFILLGELVGVGLIDYLLQSIIDKYYPKRIPLPLQQFNEE